MQALINHDQNTYNNDWGMKGSFEHAETFFPCEMFRKLLHEGMLASSSRRQNFEVFMLKQQFTAFQNFKIH